MTEAAVNFQIKFLLNILILIIALLSVSACSANSLETDGNRTIIPSSASGISRLENSQSQSAKVISILDDQSLPDGMVAFDGIVFVASTEPIPDRWQSAGWSIGSQSQATDDDQVPPDCTLYPHLGVENQWIGSCQGHTYIPKNGASHIVVIHTDLDGDTTLVQVAPQPDSKGP